MTTELESLKMKKRVNKATPKELTRLKQLQDGEPLSAHDLEVAKKREEDRKVADKNKYDEKKKVSAAANVSPGGTSVDTPRDKSLDVPPEHPRIAQMKEALLPFTKIEAHDSRPDEFILFTRGVSITAGDVRKARKAMKL